MYFLHISFKNTYCKFIFWAGLFSCIRLDILVISRCFSYWATSVYKKFVLILSVLLPVFTPQARDATSADMIKQIDYLQKRHEVLASNIANVNTPKYKAKDVSAPDFSSSKKHKVYSPKTHLKVTNARHIKPTRLRSNGKYEVVSDNSGKLKPNKNNVDMAAQISKMASNSDDVSAALKNYRSAMDLISTASDQGARR